MEAPQPNPPPPAHSPAGGAHASVKPFQVNGNAAPAQSNGQLRTSSGSGPSPRPVNSATPPQTSHPYHAVPTKNGHAALQSEPPRQYIVPPAEQAPSPPLGGNITTGHSDDPNYAELIKLTKRTNPQVLRQFIRDHWALCLLGSEYHVAFILNALMHQASPTTLSKAVQEFGQKMVQTSKHQLLQHLDSQDLDEVADMLLSKCSNNYLDQALARRLETIPARQLVNALARAERLGYDIEDIVEDKQDSKPEHVYPSGHPHFQAPVAGPPPFQGTASPAPIGAPTSSAPAIISVPGQGPAPPVVGSGTTPSFPPQMARPSENAVAGTSLHAIEFCDRCGRPCSGPKALHHHKLKEACEVRTTDMSRFNKDICLHCGCLFGTAGGLYYHKKSNVCGEYDDQRHCDVLDILKRSSGQPQLGTPGHTVQKLRTATPTPSKPTTPRNSTPTEVPSSSDPYSSLTPEQRASFDREMKDVEEHYGSLMRDVVQNLPQAQQEEELAKIKNRFNTKQSMTRKKYGIRLRARRSRAQMVEADRSLGIVTPSSSSSSIKRPRLDNRSSGASAQQSIPNHGPKPPQRVPVSEMGGLSNPSATAEHVDPTTFLTPSKPRQVPDRHSVRGSAAGSGTGSIKGLSAADPMQIDDDDDDDDSASNSDSDGSDIPAKVPAGSEHAPMAHVT